MSEYRRPHDPPPSLCLPIVLELNDALPQYHIATVQPAPVSRCGHTMHSFFSPIHIYIYLLTYPFKHIDFCLFLNLSPKIFRQAARVPARRFNMWKSSYRLIARCYFRSGGRFRRASLPLSFAFSSTITKKG